MVTPDPEAATSAPSVVQDAHTTVEPMAPLVPLPLCDGPKLAPFTQNFEHLKFEPELVIRDQDTYAHGLIIKAKLDGKTYGIKFFIEKRGHIDPTHYPELSENEIALARMQSDPFSAECRAYGRLQEEGSEHLAAKAYGYVALFINDQTEEMFKSAMAMTADGTWSGLVDFMNHLQEGPSSTAYAPDIIERPLTEPIYGIVKEWMGADEEHDVAMQWAQSPEEQMAKHQRYIDRLPRQLENLHELHRHGIVVRDLHSSQWVEGALVDLSHAWTVPHVLGQGDRYRPDWTFASLAGRDLFMFQRVINSQNEQVDHMADRLHGQGVFGPFRKSTLISYPATDSAVGSTKPQVTPATRREGLRPLPHRLLRPKEEEGEQETTVELPLLMYCERYDPDSTERFRGWAAWTHGPRWDPARFVSGKQRGHGKGDSNVLWGYIRKIKAAARRDRRSKLKAKSKATTKPSTKANSGDKVVKKGVKGSKKANRA